jgi:hypothetical protein
MIASTEPQPRSDAGIATAEDGVVILEGPNGVAVTMTAEAASQTGASLIAAARLAELQISGNGGLEGG